MPSWRAQMVLMLKGFFDELYIGYVEVLAVSKVKY